MYNKKVKKLQLQSNFFTFYIMWKIENDLYEIV